MSQPPSRTEKSTSIGAPAFRQVTLLVGRVALGGDAAISQQAPSQGDAWVLLRKGRPLELAEEHLGLGAERLVAADGSSQAQAADRDAGPVQ